MMDALDRIAYYRNKIETTARLKEAVDEACDFIPKSGEELRDALDALLEGGCRREYKLLPFGEDASGGVYVLVDDVNVAYITSEGQAGYVARSVDDFYKILLNCGYLSDYLDEEVLCDADSFCGAYEEIRENGAEPGVLDAFLSEEGMRLEPEELYVLLKQGLSVTPPFEIEPEEEDYEGSENLLRMEREAFAELIRRWEEQTPREG